MSVFGTIYPVTHACAGEFRVDFDDEAEGEAWISAGQQWRGVGPSLEAVALDPAALVAEPVLSHLMQAPTTCHQPAPTAPVAMAPALVPASIVVELPGQDVELSRIVAAEFAELLSTTIKADGRSPEPLPDTRTRFAALYEAIAIEDREETP
mmetsp:Transcript_13520/g.34676  ORF Transcript_13520/g.34676 Transcript_13520/m.34676 type:complete len:152 (-) Transcript_13520:278-733(-)